jgi:hypothetical protein
VVVQDDDLVDAVEGADAGDLAEEVAADEGGLREADEGVGQADGEVGQGGWFRGR